MFITKLKVNSSGDTIIEVLIAMVILALILTGGYVTTNNQALGIAQYQLETLRALANAPSTDANSLANAANTNYLPGGAGHNVPFCFSTSGNLKSYASGQCTSFGSGASAIKYNVNIQGQGNGVTQPVGAYPINTYTFQVKVTWNGLNRDVKTDQLNLYYRVAV